MASTLAERQHTGNDPLQISLWKMTLNFGATMSATILKNRGNIPRGSTPPYESRSSSRWRRTVDWRITNKLVLFFFTHFKSCLSCKKIQLFKKITKIYYTFFFQKEIIGYTYICTKCIDNFKSPVITSNLLQMRSDITSNLKC